MAAFLLYSKWGEPESGSDSQQVELYDDDVAHLESDIAWLEEHATEDLGSALPSWALLPIKGHTTVSDADLVGLEAIRKHMVLNSRYEEDPTFYGSEPYEPYAAIAGKPYWPEPVKIITWVNAIHDLDLRDLEDRLHEFRDLPNEPRTRIVSLPADHVSDSSAVLLVWQGPENATDAELVAAFTEAWNSEDEG